MKRDGSEALFYTVASKKFSVSLPAPSPEEDRVHKEFRTTPRFSPDEKPKKRRSPEEKPRRRRFPVVPQGPRIVDIEPDYKPGPRTAARRRVHARRSDVQLPALQRKTRRRKKWYTPPPAPSPRRYLGPGHGGKQGGGPGAPRARAASLGVAGHQPAAGGISATRRRLGRVALHPRAQPADGAEQHPHGAVVN